MCLLTMMKKPVKQKLASLNGKHVLHATIAFIVCQLFVFILYSQVLWHIHRSDQKNKLSPDRLQYSLLDAQEKHTLEVIQAIHSFSSNTIALLFSPYDFSVGGGEKYFLEAASYFQRTGFHVTILTDIGNICKVKECVHEVAMKLDVNLTLDFNYFPVEYWQ